MGQNENTGASQRSNKTLVVAIAIAFVIFATVLTVALMSRNNSKQSNNSNQSQATDVLASARDNVRSELFFIHSDLSTMLPAYEKTIGYDANAFTISDTSVLFPYEPNLFTVLAKYSDKVKERLDKLNSEVGESGLSDEDKSKVSDMAQEITKVLTPIEKNLQLLNDFSSTFVAPIINYYNDESATALTCAETPEITKLTTNEDEKVSAVAKTYFDLYCESINYRQVLINTDELRIATKTHATEAAAKLKPILETFTLDTTDFLQKIESLEMEFAK